jgi:hypothetical protein
MATHDADYVAEITGIITLSSTIVSAADGRGDLRDRQKPDRTMSSGKPPVGKPKVE